MFRRLFNREPPAKQSQVPSTQVIRETTRGLKGKRVSVEPGTLNGTSLFEAFARKFEGQPNKTRAEVIKTFRRLAQADDDVSGALRDATALAITTLSWELHGTDAAVTQAEAALEELTEHAFPTGLHGLAKHQARELYLTGASSVEWVPTADVTGIDYAAIVPAETIAIRRGEGRERRYFQIPVLGGTTFSTVDEVELDARTYKYVALELDGDNPYGVPAGISALPMLNRKHDILRGEDRLIEAAQNLALVTAAVANPDPETLGCKTAYGPEYQKALGEYMGAIADLMSAGSQNGLYVHPEGVEVKTTSLNQNLQGTTDISEKNQKHIWSGLATQGYLRGDLSANYALARVIHPQVVAFAEDIRASVITALEFGMNLHLQLAGIPAWVEVTFDDPPNPFRLEDAQTELVQAQIDELMLKVVGEAWMSKVSARTGLTEEELLNSRASKPQSESIEPVETGEETEEDTSEALTE